ncbi:hypothetical protein BJ944DRAFT_270590 [Cunninghamella echinulata]|nr:hypothetical protein BJ944DRAFT_270590 [Cunninghamella echinulata]
MKLQLLIALISFVTYSTQFNATCLNDYPNDKKCVNAVESLFGSEEFKYYNNNGEVMTCSNDGGENPPPACECYKSDYRDLLCSLDSIIKECPPANYPGNKLHPVVETCTTEEERNKLLGYQNAYETKIKNGYKCELETNPTC